MAFFCSNQIDSQSFWLLLLLLICIGSANWLSRRRVRSPPTIIDRFCLILHRLRWLLLLQMLAAISLELAMNHNLEELTNLIGKRQPSDPIVSALKFDHIRLRAFVYCFRSLNICISEIVWWSRKTLTVFSSRLLCFFYAK